MPFVIGEVDATIKRDPSLLFDNEFNDGLGGWVQLVSGTQPAGPIGLVTMPGLGDGMCLSISTEDKADTGGLFGSAMAIKRLTRISPAGKVTFDVWWAWKAYHGANNFRAIDFGIDTADAAGARVFYKFRWLNYDEGGAAQVQKLQLATGTLASPTFTDFPGSPTFALGLNENKSNLAHFVMVVDLATGFYEGFSANGTGYGSLAAVPDTSLHAFAPPGGTLTAFANGMNFAVELRNRTNTNSSKSWVFLDRARGVVG